MHIPLTLITGFLGSGKTTLLNRLLRDPDFRDSGVVVNEVGEIGVDQLLVEAGGEEMLVMEGGCFCCSLRDGLAEAVGRLIRRREAEGLPPFRRFVVETSGASDPLPLLQQLIGDPRLSGRVLLDGVVTVVDAVLGEATLQNHPEAESQAAMADLLLLSKTDLAGAAELDRLEARLQVLNPGAARLRTTAAPAAAVIGLSPDPAGRDPGRWLDPIPPGLQALGASFQTASVELPGPLDPEVFESWMEELMAFGGAGLLRLKGVLTLSGDERPVVVHAVQHLVHAPLRLDAWPPGVSSGRLTLIARGLEPGTLRRALDWLREQARPPA